MVQTQFQRKVKVPTRDNDLGNYKYAQNTYLLKN